MSTSPTGPGEERPAGNPPPLTVAAALSGLQGAVLVGLAVIEAAATSSDRPALGVSTAVFFALYGLVLVAAGVALARRRTWARGPVLVTQLFSLGLAWNLRDSPLPALALAVSAVVVLAGVLHPDSMRVLSDEA